VFIKKAMSAASQFPNDEGHLESSFVEAYYEDDWETIQRLVQQQPRLLHQALLETSTFRDVDLPLHETVLQDSLRRSSPDPNQAVQADLLRLDPTIAHDETEEGDLPIHLAARNSTITVETLRLLVEAYPESLLFVTWAGNTPLHNALLKSYNREGYEGHEEKAQYLLKANPKAATIPNRDGDFPLHLAAEEVMTDDDDDVIWDIYRFHPAAILHRNKQGMLPLDLAMKQLPFSKHVCKVLLCEHNPDPSKTQWLDRTKSSFWVQQNYSKVWIESRLELPTDDDEHSSFEDDDDYYSSSANSSSEEDPAEIGSPSEIATFLPTDVEQVQEYNTCFAQQSDPHVKIAAGSPTKKLKISEDSLQISSSCQETNGTHLAEDAIQMTLGWLSSSKGLLAVSGVSKYLRSEVPKVDAWETILKDLDQSVGLDSNEHPAKHAFFPREFVDPRLCPDYVVLSPYKKAMYLGQYKAMVLQYIRAPMDEDAEDFLRELLNKIRRTVRAANAHGYFDPGSDNEFDSGSDHEFEGSYSRKPANVDESLARCNLDGLKKYVTDVAETGFHKSGILGWSFSLVCVGWENIHIGPTGDHTYVMMCHKIAGLDVIIHGWHGMASF
jgi:hypothetical protein